MNDPGDQKSQPPPGIILREVAKRRLLTLRNPGAGDLVVAEKNGDYIYIYII